MKNTTSLWILFLVLGLFCHISAFSQNSLSIDSLYNELELVPGSSKQAVDLLMEIADEKIRISKQEGSLVIDYDTDAKKAYGIALTINYPYGMAKSHIQFTREYLRKNKLDMVLKELAKTDSLLQFVPDGIKKDKLAIKIKQYQGVALLNLRRLSEAMEFFIDGIMLAKEKKLNDELVYFRLNYSKLFSIIGDFETAIGMLSSLNSTTKDTTLKAAIVFDMCLNLINSGQFDSLEVYVRELKQLNKNRHPDYLAKYYLFRAVIYKNNNEQKMAEECFEKAMTLCHEYNFIPVHIYCDILYNYAILYLENKEYNKALDYSKKAIVVSKNESKDSLGLEYDPREFYLASSIYDSLKQFDSAYHYLSKAIEYERDYRELIDMKGIVKKNEQYVYQLREQNLVIKHNTRNLIFIIGSVVLAFIIVIMLLLMRNSRHKQRIKDQELEKTNRRLASSLMKQAKNTEFYKEVINRLKNVIELKDTHLQTKEIRQTINILQKHSNNSLWNDFDHSFTNVYGKFYQNLQKDFPQLTTRERRLCAFLCMGMNTKEIANISNLSPETVRKSRVQLRKKINLTHESIELETFLRKYQ